MLRLATRKGPTIYQNSSLCRLHQAGRHISTHANKHEPLNILFCGADDFSIHSLRALRELQGQNAAKIASIEVVCRPDKRVGRGLREIHAVPIKPVANEVGLKLHQLDTFKGWSLPPSINLIVAVSFGLLVPARILETAKYGGLNVHPSLLPDLRGPAPIVHTLLKQRPYTGVTLQTMHPIRFDHGTILAQTPSPGIPVSPGCTPVQLLNVLGPVGGSMLRHGINQGLFVPPVKDICEGMPEPKNLDHAPKITPEDRHINWNTWTADDVILRGTVLDRLWDSQTYGNCFSKRQASPATRVVFHGPWSKVSEPLIRPESTSSPGAGEPEIIRVDGAEEWRLCFRTCDGQLVRPAAATIDGGKKGTGLIALSKGLIESR